MKKIILFLSSIALALLATSCLQQHTTLTLNKDGSGLITEKLILGDQMIAMMSQFAEEGQDPLDDMFKQTKANAEKSVKKMGEGVTVKEVKRFDEGGKKGMIVVYAFEDINKLKYSFGQGLNSMNEGEEGAEEAEDDPINFSYKDGVLTILNEFDGDAGKKDDEEEAPEPDEASMAMAKQMLKDMQISLKLEIPSGIAKTNAEYVDGNVVTLADLKMAAIVEDPERFKKFSQEPGSLAEMRELIKGVEGVKIETNEKVTIELK